MWKVIKENKDLDLPTHKVMYFLLSVYVCECVCNSIVFICIYLFDYQIMVATVRCEEIANEKVKSLDL
jgi:hypothetical protein